MSKEIKDQNKDEDELEDSNNEQEEVVEDSD